MLDSRSQGNIEWPGVQNGRSYLKREFQARRQSCCWVQSKQSEMMRFRMFDTDCPHSCVNILERAGSLRLCRVGSWSLQVHACF